MDGVRILSMAAASAVALAIATVGVASAQPGPVAGLPKPVTSAAQLRTLSRFTDPAALAYATMAYEVAGKAWPTTLAFRCTAQMAHVESGQGDPPPTKIFDNLVYIGHADVGAWALKTSAGIILFDAMNDEKDARWIAEQMPAVGLDPKDIKLVLITHEHGDHYGGAPYLKRTYGARLAASQVTWDNMAKPNPFPAPAPVRAGDDIVLTDGGVVTLGDATVTAVLTPGHTPGTTSFIFPAKNHGETVMVADWGGNGMPTTLEGRQTFRRSIQHFTEYSEKAGVAAEVIAHGDTDDLLTRLAAVRRLKAGEANPFLIGRETYLRYEQAFNLCTSADIAQSIADARARK